MTAKRKAKPIPVPSVRTIAGAVIALRKVMKDEHGLDVDIKVNIHGWTSTTYLARLVVADIAEDGGASWTNEWHTADSDDKLTFFCANGGGLDKDLDVTIFKREGVRAGKKRKLLKSPPKSMSKSAWAVHRLCSLSRELYGVDANVVIEAWVEASWSIFSTSKNPHVTPEVATEVLGDVATGTDWLQKKEVSTYPSRTNIHRYKLQGEGIDFEIRMELPKEEAPAENTSS
jgi:hypothetical protein